jgi:predicted transcriptional regulator
MMTGCVKEVSEEPITKAEDVIKIISISLNCSSHRRISFMPERMRKYKISQIPVIDILVL